MMPDRWRCGADALMTDEMVQNRLAKLSICSSILGCAVEARVPGGRGSEGKTQNPREKFYRKKQFQKSHTQD